VCTLPEVVVVVVVVVVVFSILSISFDSFYLTVIAFRR
jgi:hypothetical protein